MRYNMPLCSISTSCLPCKISLLDTLVSLGWAGEGLAALGQVLVSAGWFISLAILKKVNVTYYKCESFSFTSQICALCADFFRTAFVVLRAEAPCRGG